MAKKISSQAINNENSDSSINQWLIDGFHEFIKVHVECFSNHKEVPLHFIGSIAYYFKDELLSVCNQRGIRVGNIIKAPIDGLADYHLKNKIH